MKSNLYAYQFYFFDLDGTLLESKTDVVESLARSFEAFNLPIDLGRIPIGPPLEQIIKLMAPPGIEDQQILDLAQHFRTTYNSSALEHTHLYPGCEDWLKSLKDLGKTLCLATNKPWSSTENVLRPPHRNILPYFSAIATPDMNPGSFLKKSQTLAILCERLGAKPEQCLMIGDTLGDAEAARANGMDFMAFEGGYGGPSLVADSRAEYSILDYLSIHQRYPIGGGTARQTISVLTPCYNEEDNVDILCERLSAVFAQFPQYDFEHIFIDNASTDRTVEKIKARIAGDARVRLIVNARNFGHIRSPYYGMMQCQGDAVVCMASDLQDPPEVIREFIEKWESGYKIVVGVKNQSRENKLMFFFRKAYYRLLSKMSTTEQIQNFTGFGLYDRSFIEVIKQVDDPYPYFRGLIGELGFDRTEVNFIQPRREHGQTKNNFFTLYDMAMLGFVSHSKLPLRLASFIGFFTALLSLLAALIYLIYKLIYWDTFTAGTAPLVIGLFFFAAVQLFFIGIIGEYIGAIHTQVRKRPYVIERERVNF